MKNGGEIQENLNKILRQAVLIIKRISAVGEDCLFDDDDLLETVDRIYNANHEITKTLNATLPKFPQIK